MRFKTVSLEHIQPVADIKCANNRIEVQFSNDEAYKQAAESWKAKGLGSGLVLVSYQEGCGAAWPEQRSFLYMTSFSQKFAPESRTISGGIKEIKPLMVAKAIDIKFGQYTQASETVPSAKGLALMPDLDRDINYPFSWTPSTDSETPFGKATTLFRYQGDTPVGTADAGVFCVGCGASGALKLAGHVSIGLNGFIPQINKLAVDLDMNMKTRMAVSAHGDVPPTGAIQTRLVDTILGSFSIADLVAIKPSLSLDFGGKAESKLTGDALYGYELNWPGLKANMDLVALSFNSSGLEPEIKPVTEARGKADAKVEAQPTTTLNIVADVMMGQFQGKLLLVDKHYLNLDAQSQTGCAKVDVKNDISVEAGFAGQKMSWPSIPYGIDSNSFCAG